MRLVGKSSKSLLACEQNSRQSINSMVKKKKSVRVSREMSQETNFFSMITKTSCFQEKKC